MIKNIVFDIGNVLVGYNHENYAKQLGMQIDKVNKANDILVKSNEWKQYLNGNIKLEEILYRFHKQYQHLKQEFSLILEKENIKYTIYEIEENTNLLKESSKKYDIYLLSNVTKETLESIEEKFDFIKYIKGGVYSYQEHISKPEKEIFQKLLEMYKLKVEETIYIDDRQKNIDVAKEMEMIGVFYQENKSLREIIGGIVS